MSPDIESEFTGTKRFRILRRLGAGGMGVVYEVHDRERDVRVALKTMLRANATTVYYFKQEFRALAELVHPNLLPLYEMISDGNHWFFTMEYVDGTDFLSFVRLDDSLQSCPTGHDSTAEFVIPPPPAPGRAVPRASAPVTPPDFDRLRESLRQLAAGVSALHERAKLHRDLKPANVLVRKGGHVLLLDFGLVAELGATPPRETTSGASPDSSQSTLLWKRRSERHIAGTAAYMAPEQAAGEALTPASDWYAMGVMLFEAITGELPIQGSVHEMLRMKQALDAPRPAELLEKVPDDLDSLCARLLERAPAKRPGGAEILAGLGVSTPSVTVTAGDSPAPSREALPFVGRERQLADLWRMFERKREGRPVVCEVFGKSGAGKSTLVQRFLNDLQARTNAVVLTGRCYEQESVPYKALDSLVDDLTDFLLRLPDGEAAAVVPPGIGALVRIFPVLKRVRAVQAARSEYEEPGDLREAQRRAIAALRELLARIAKRRPLVLAIDDFQWGDVDSAVMLSTLLRPKDGPALLLLLAYRSEYVTTSKSLEAFTAAQHAAQITEARATTIEVGALAPREAVSLALRLLGENDAAATARAEWVARESRGSAYFVHELLRSLEAGMTRERAEGVGLDEVLWQRVCDLPDDARRCLEVVAIAGQPMSVRHAEQAARLSSSDQQVVARLRSEHLVRSTGPGLDDEIETYHDRIRESVVGHLDAEVVRDHHGALARTLEAAGADPERLAVHFLGAGHREQAARYFESAADNAVQVLALKRAEEFYRQALELAERGTDRTRLFEKLIHFETNLAHFHEAYELGRRALRPFGIRLPARFVPPLFMADFARAKVLLRGRRIEEIVDLPVMTDERRITAIRLMAAVGKAAYQKRPELCVAVLVKMVNLCLRHGNTPDCAIGFMAFGAIFLGGVRGDHPTGYAFGRLALALVDRFDNEAQRAEVSFVVGYFATSWLRPAQEAETLWQTAYRSGRATGDLFHMGCARAATIMSQHMRGVPMDDLLAACDDAVTVLERASLHEPARCITVVRQCVRNLQGRTFGPTTLSDDEFDEVRHAARLDQYGSRHLALGYFVGKMEVLYLRGHHEEALELARASVAFLKDSPGMLHSAEQRFYHALILAARHARDEPSTRPIVRRIRTIGCQFHDWARACPDNFLHKACVLAGEVCRVTGDAAGARSAYEEAIAAARRFRYLQIEALAHRLTADLLRSTDPDASARHLDAARDAYTRWGATEYARTLEQV